MEKSTGQLVTQLENMLETINISVVAEGGHCITTTKLGYKNKSLDPLECVFICPLERDAAFLGFSANIDDKEVHSKVVPKQEAW